MKGDMHDLQKMSYGVSVVNAPRRGGPEGGEEHGRVGNEHLPETLGVVVLQYAQSRLGHRHGRELGVGVHAKGVSALVLAAVRAAAALAGAE